MAEFSQQILQRALELQSQSQPVRPSLEEQIAADRAQYDATRGNTWGEAIGNVGPQLVSGAVSLGQQAYGAANMMSLGFLDRATGLSQNFQQTQNILSQAQSAPTQRAAQEVGATFENEGVWAGIEKAASSPAFLQQAAVQTLPSLLPAAGYARFASTTAGASALARGLAEKEARELVSHSAEKAVLIASGAQSAGGTNVDAINAIRDAGGSENLQQAGGLGAGAITGALTPVIGKLSGAAALEGRAANLFGGTLPATGAAATAGAIARGVGQGALREGLEESSQSSVEQMAQNIVTPGKSLMDGVGMQFGVGALLGAGLGGAMGGLSVNTPRVDTPLKQELAAAKAAANEAAGNPIQPTALGEQAETQDIADTLQAVPDAPLTDIPLPDGNSVRGQEVDLGATPLPTVQPDPNVENITIPGLDVENIDITPAVGPTGRAADDLSPYQRNQLRALGVTDETLGSLSTADAMVQLGQPGIDNVDMTAAAVPGQDIPLYDQDYRVPAPLPQVDGNFGATTWKERMAKELGLKGGSFNSGTWKQFVVDAEASGYHPEDSNSAQFLGKWAAGQIATASNKTSEFVEKLAAAYPVAQQAVPVAPQPVPTGEATPAPVEATPQVAPTKVQQKAARRAERAAVAAVQQAIQIEANVQAGAAALAPVTEATPSTPGSPGTKPAPLTMDQMIRQAMSNDPEHTLSSATADAYIDAMMDVHNPYDLDELFASIKNHTGWNKLTDADKTEVADSFTKIYARMDEDAGRFDRAAEPVAPSEAIPLQELRDLVAAANRNRPQNSGEIFVAPTVADFQAMTSLAAPADARGVFTKENFNRIYLIGENLRDAKDVAITLAHERGHNGLATLLGDRLPAVVNRLWTNPATRRRIQDKIKQLKLEGNGGAANGGIRRLAAEEVLADMFAAGEPVANDVITKARAAIEQGMASLLGLGKLTMKNSEVDALLRDVGAVLHAAPGSMVRNDAHPGLEDLMADPAPWLATSARFSRASANMDRIINDATVEGGGTRSKLADAVREATIASADLVRSAVTQSPIATGKKAFEATGTFRDRLRGWALDATPLNQIANLYKGMFGGQLSTLARLKRAKESLYNKLLTAPAEMSYRGERMTTSPVQAKDAWDKLRSSSKAKGEALDALQQTATLYKLFPDQDLASQSVLDHSKAGFTVAERAAAMRDVHRLWKAIGPEGQKVYKQSQAVYANLKHQHFDALVKAIESAGTSRYVEDSAGNPLLNEKGTPVTTKTFRDEMKRNVDSALTKMMQGPYSPLKRYGDYMITVKSADGSRTVDFQGFDTIEEQKRAEVEMRREYPKEQYRVIPTLRREFDLQLDGISQDTISKIERAVDGMAALKENPGLRAQIHQGLVDAYLQSLPDSSLLQHARERKNIKGATTDAFRAFNDYSTTASRRVASLTHDGDIDRQLTNLQKYVTDKTATGNVSTDDAIKMQRVLTAVRRQHAASQKGEHSPLADFLGAAGFVQFLSSPSQLLMNALQTPMITLPRMAAAYGNSLGIKVFNQSLVHFVKSRGDLLGANSVLAKDSPEHQVLTELFNRGTLDFTQSHDMTGLANGQGAAMSGHWRKAMQVAGFAMQKSEVFNRQVTALAVVRAEMTKAGPGEAPDIQALADLAEDVVYDTQGDYSQANKPPIMQGPWRRLIMQFQHYRLNMLAMMARDIRDSFTGTKQEKQSARRALAWTLGMQLLLTGAAGSVLAPIVFGIMDMFRDDDDLLDSRTEALRFLSPLISHGVLANLFDLSRVSGAGLLSVGQQYAPIDASAKETFLYYLTANTPAIGLGANIATGIEGMMEGDHLKAAKNLMPAIFRDPYKAYFESQQGAKDTRGVVYYTPNLYDGVLGAFGLRSGDRTAAEELRGAAYEADKTAQMLRTRIAGKYAMAQMEGNFDLLAEAQDQNAAFAAKYPGMGVVPKSAIVNRLRTQQNATETGIATSRPLEPAMREVLGL
jgi:hypothetical protein